MNGSTTSVVISGEGVTTLSFFATDNAGNTSDTGTYTVKLDKTRLTRSDAVATIQTLQYKGGAVTTPAEHRVSISWTGPASGFKSLDQNLSVSTPLQSGKASWKWNDDVTEIKLLAGGVTTKTTVPGMFLLRLATNAGALSIEATP